MKRSSQVALLLMGATGAGAGAYALTPRTCVPSTTTPPAINAPVASGVHSTQQPCSTSSRSWSTGWRSYSSSWSQPLFSRTSTTGNAPPGSVPLAGRSSTPSGSSSSIPSSSRGGFGSTGHAMSSGS